MNFHEKNCQILQLCPVKNLLGHQVFQRTWNKDNWNRAVISWTVSMRTSHQSRSRFDKLQQKTKLIFFRLRLKFCCFSLGFGSMCDGCSFVLLKNVSHHNEAECKLGCTISCTITLWPLRYSNWNVNLGAFCSAPN